MDDEILRRAADDAGIEFTGGKKEVPPPEVSTDPLGNLSLRWEDDNIQVQVNQIERGRRSLDCYMSVRQIKPPKWIDEPSRINLLSKSAKTQLRRDLNERSPLDWATRISQIVVAVNNSLAGRRRAKILARRAGTVDQDWLAKPLLERNEHTMVVAAPGTGKSLLSLAIVASVKAQEQLVPGLEVGGFEGGVLYLDWETNEQTHERRLTMLCDTAGIEIPEVHYIRMSVPIIEDVQYLYEYVVRNRIRLVVVDSVGVATGGDMNTQADAIAYISAIRALGDVTVLSITHPGWSDEKRSGGSRYFEAAPRAVWRMEKKQEQDESESHIDFTNYMANNGIMQPDFALQVSFVDGIRYSSTEVSAEKQPAREQIMDLLVSTGKMRLEAIYEELLDVPKATIRKALERMQKAGDVQQFDRGEYAVIVTKNPRHSDVTTPVSDNPPLKGGGSMSQVHTGKKEKSRQGDVTTYRHPYPDAGDVEYPGF